MTGNGSLLAVVVFNLLDSSWFECGESACSECGQLCWICVVWGC